ncbi:class I SAM-dependent methyltransferase [Patescibacteria group bacterium]|nr:class I SAM-dependent methyltransferase [Patescibacteria group bacterium]
MVKTLQSYLRKIWHHSAYLNNEILTSYVEPAKTASILDLGCDDGSIAVERFKNKINNPNIFGLDADLEKLKQARKRGIKAIKANVEKPFPFNSEAFDLVSANQIIEHLANADRFLKEIYRVLRPGGYLVLATENLSSWHNMCALLLGWQPFSQHISTVKNVGNPLRIARYENYPIGGMHVRVFAPRGLKEIIELHQFTIEESFGAGHYPFPSTISKALSYIDPTHAAFIGVKARKMTTKPA